MPGPIAAFLAFLVLFTGAAGWLMIFRAWLSGRYVVPGSV